MSRIGNQPIIIPDGVEVNFKDQVMTVKKGQESLSQVIDPRINVEMKDGHIHFTRKEESKAVNALHGLYRSLVHNMVVGLTEGFTKTLSIQGVGYRAELQGKKLILSVGYSQKVEVEPAEGIIFEVPKENTIIIKGADKQLVGETAAKIRAVRPPEPYKGKGIRYKDEVVHIKVGKTGA